MHIPTVAEYEQLTDTELIELGRQLCTAHSVSEIPVWAGRVLIAASRTQHEILQIQAVVDATQNREKWQDCHRLFQNVRMLTLDEEKRRDYDKLRLSILLLAENVAKATYNASGAPAPFDADSCWWIPHCVQSLLAACDDQGLTEEIFRELFS